VQVKVETPNLEWAEEELIRRDVDRIDSTRGRGMGSIHSRHVSCPELLSACVFRTLDQAREKADERMTVSNNYRRHKVLGYRRLSNRKPMPLEP
jgi:hypothetical protein